MTGPRRALALALAATALSLPGCVAATGSPLARLEAPEPLPQPATTWLDLGRQLLDADLPEPAKDAFIRSIRLEGMSAAALTGAGVAAERQGLLHEAKRYFERALARAPDSVIAHNNLGAVLYRLGEPGAARQAFQQAFALSSGTSGAAAQNLALAELAMRRDEETALAPNPRRLQRRGSAEYKLVARPALEGDG